MGTTTIRVDSDTHARLLELSTATGTSLMETVRDAAEALRRQRFAHQVGAELTELRDNPEAWEAYLVEADSTSVTGWHRLTTSGSSTLASQIPANLHRIDQRS